MPQLTYIILSVLLSGCSLLQNLDGALTLKAYSAEQDAKEKEVKKQNARYELLKHDVMDYSIRKYNKEACVKRFGEPLVVDLDQEGLERWLYHPYGMTVLEKIYLYFTPDGKIAKTDYVEDKP